MGHLIQNFYMKKITMLLFAGMISTQLFAQNTKTLAVPPPPPPAPVVIDAVLPPPPPPPAPVVEFTPPKIIKNKPARPPQAPKPPKAPKAPAKEAKFTPPVIVKDKE